jgi:hypothetical protein
MPIKMLNSKYQELEQPDKWADLYGKFNKYLESRLCGGNFLDLYSGIFLVRISVELPAIILGVFHGVLRAPRQMPTYSPFITNFPSQFILCTVFYAVETVL